MFCTGVTSTSRRWARGMGLARGGSWVPNIGKCNHSAGSEFEIASTSISATTPSCAYFENRSLLPRSRRNVYTHSSLPFIQNISHVHLSPLLPFLPRLFLPSPISLHPPFLQLQHHAPSFPSRCPDMIQYTDSVGMLSCHFIGTSLSLCFAANY